MWTNSTLLRLAPQKVSDGEVGPGIGSSLSVRSQVWRSNVLVFSRLLPSNGRMERGYLLVSSDAVAFSGVQRRNISFPQRIRKGCG